MPAETKALIVVLAINTVPCTGFGCRSVGRGDGLALGAAPIMLTDRSYGGRFTPEA
jgi:hypothetical protein